MPTISVTCSWCHTLNKLLSRTPNLCSYCGHRSDLARMDCDCVKCLGLFARAISEYIVHGAADALCERSAPSGIALNKARGANDNNDGPINPEGDQK